MANKKKPKADKRYVDGRGKGKPVPGKKGGSIAQRKNSAYGSPTSQARQTAFRAAVALKSNKKPASKVKMNKKGK